MEEREVMTNVDSFVARLGESLHLRDLQMGFLSQQSDHFIVEWNSANNFVIHSNLRCFCCRFQVRTLRINYWKQHLKYIESCWQLTMNNLKLCIWRNTQWTRRTTNDIVLEPPRLHSMQIIIAARFRSPPATNASINWNSLLNKIIFLLHSNGWLSWWVQERKLKFHPIVSRQCFFSIHEMVMAIVLIFFCCLLPANAVFNDQARKKGRKSLSVFWGLLTNLPDTRRSAFLGLCCMISVSRSAWVRERCVRR